MGEAIACCAASTLFVLMFFHWFGVEARNTSNLLFEVQSVEAGKSAWDALSVVPAVLTINVVCVLGLSAIRLLAPVQESVRSLHAAAAILGVVSSLMILYRIVNPPVFGAETTITFEGTVQLPIVLAFLAAVTMALGSLIASTKMGGMLAGMSGLAVRVQRRVAARRRRPG